MSKSNILEIIKEPTLEGLVIQKQILIQKKKELELKVSRLDARIKKLEVQEEVLAKKIIEEKYPECTNSIYGRKH